MIEKKRAQISYAADQSAKQTRSRTPTRRRPLLLLAEGILSALRAVPSRPVSSKDRRDDGSEMLVGSRIKSAQKLQRHKTYPCPAPSEARCLPAHSESLLLALLRAMLPSQPVSSITLKGQEGRRE